MTYKLHNKPDLKFESLAVLAAVFGGGEGIRKDMDETIKNNGGEFAAETREMFADSIAIEDLVRQELDYDTGILKFLYTKREMAGNIPAIVFYTYEIFAGTALDSKLLAVLSYADDDAFTTPEMIANPPSAIGEGELFMLLESTGLDAAFKYELMELYFRFDEYHLHYKNITAAVSALIAKNLPAFEDKIETFITKTSAVLEEKGLSYFREKWGLEIKGDVDFDIFPALYAANSISIIGLPAPYAARNTISIGLRVDELTDMCDNCRPISKILPDYFKAMADSTKWTILQMLKAEPLYGGQLAERLSLTGATISHHMKALKDLDLIVIRKDASRVYYSLNKEKIKEFLEGLEGMF